MIPEVSDNIRAKAIDLLSSGRVTVTAADDTSGMLVASVAGDSDSYTTFRDRHGSPWRCTCKAGLQGLPCSHVHSVALVAG